MTNCACNSKMTNSPQGAKLALSFFPFMCTTCVIFALLLLFVIWFAHLFYTIVLHQPK